ncbi:hypothetical protein pb186bvf_012320 [Paramecium bursaria]
MAKKKEETVDIDELRKKMIPILKVAIIGPQRVGKTSFVNQFVNNCFEPYYEETENDLRRYKKVYDLNQNPTDPQYVLFQIEDIFPCNHQDLVRQSDPLKSNLYCGILENRSQRYKQSLCNPLEIDKQIYGYIFVFDARKEESFEALKEPMRYISQYCEDKRKFSGLTTKKIIVANMTDLMTQESSDQCIKPNMKKYLDHNMAGVPIIKASAKTADKVNFVFEELGKSILSDQTLEMIDKDWLQLVGKQINETEAQVNKEKNKKEEKKQNKPKTKGFMCAGGRKAAQLEEPVEEDDEEDDEFTNLDEYPGMMDEQKEGCVIQ